MTRGVWLDGLFVFLHNVNADPLKIGKAGLDVPVHAFRSLSGDALQQADLVKIFRYFLWGTGVNAFIQIAFPE